MNRRPVTTLVLLAGLLAAPAVAAPGFTASAAPPVIRATTRVSVATGGAQANGQSGGSTISTNGRYVAFASDATNLVAGDTNDAQDVFVHDGVSGATTRVSVATRGTQANNSSFGPAAISADGRYVAFSSAATNLVAGATGGVFVRDRVAGTTTLVSESTGGAKASGAEPAISADGRYVAFSSSATNLVAGDTIGGVFVRDRVKGTTTRVSVSTQGAQASGAEPAISADGRYVAFSSSATNLVAGDTNRTGDVFVRDRVSGTTTRASVATNGTQGNLTSAQPAISANGRYVAFGSIASNLVADDTNGIVDVFVRDRVKGTTTRVSVATNGTQTTRIDFNRTTEDSDRPAISADGRYVAFLSGFPLVAQDTNGIIDVYVRDRINGTTTRASVATNGTQLVGSIAVRGIWDRPGISADGRYITFASPATNLVARDTNGVSDVFVSPRP
jgi:Tol biopolymer transport system component